MRTWILFFHVLSVMVWLGGSIYVEALMAAAGRGNEESFLAVFRRVGPTNRRLFNLAGVATIVFGFWLVFISPGWEFEMIWVTVGILLATIAVVIDLFYATPRTDRVERMMDDPEQSNDAVSAVITQVINAGHVRVGLLFVAFVFMIFKF
ncbi:MAG: DUF2269 family protein [Actinomycetota bacterium]|nr:DUF2269 family protein [Actinomycetota bacterium]